MTIDVNRFCFGRDSTAGLLFIDGEFECYTVEDQERHVEPPLRSKIQGETAIPRGIYDVRLRDVGGFHQRYLNRYGEEFHKGMLELQDVPGFKYILFHTGNTSDHTEGCILVGDTIRSMGKESMIPPGRTRGAYKRFYPKIRDAILGGDQVRVVVGEV